VSSASVAAQLDVCTTCGFVWFDPLEFESLTVRPQGRRPEDGLSPEARRAFAIAQTEQQASLMSANNPPTELWQLIPAFLGLPVEEEYDALQRAPWLTWLLIGAISLIGGLVLTRFPGAVAEFGLIPASPLRYGGLTFVTSLFLHAGVAHLATTMYFLFIFGDNVEDYLGKARYALLFLLAGMAGGIFHTILEPRSALPCVGASGAIFGIVVFYALRFPHAQLGFFARWSFAFRWVRMPAYMFLGFWLLAELFGAWQQVAGFTGVSALAHLGGAGVGFLFWLRWRNL
jgi:membrane associated rhomboid family serine protease